MSGGAGPSTATISGAEAVAESSSDDEELESALLCSMQHATAGSLDAAAAPPSPTAAPPSPEARRSLPLDDSDDDDELESALLESMEHANDDRRAEQRRQARLDEHVALSLQQQEYAAAASSAPPPPPRSSRAPCEACLLLALPEEVVRRVLSFVSVPYLLTTVRLVSKRVVGLVASEVRERTTRSLHDAMAAGFASSGGASSGAKSDALPEARLRELPPLATAIEAAIRALSPPHRTLMSKCRSICFNLSDPKNPELRGRLLSGELTPHELVRMGTQEMASLALQRQRSEWQRKRLVCTIRPERVHGFATDLYRCDGCGCQQTRVHRVIRPGRAIDRARTYATCRECNARWEV
jgi:hypothetical protein